MEVQVLARKYFYYLLILLILRSNCWLLELMLLGSQILWYVCYRPAYVPLVTVAIFWDL